jgi:hypothetical protein
MACISPASAEQPALDQSARFWRDFDEQERVTSASCRGSSHTPARWEPSTPGRGFCAPVGLPLSLLIPPTMPTGIQTSKRRRLCHRAGSRRILLLSNSRLFMGCGPAQRAELCEGWEWLTRLTPQDAQQQFPVLDASKVCRSQRGFHRLKPVLV